MIDRNTYNTHARKILPRGCMQGHVPLFLSELTPFVYAALRFLNDGWKMNFLILLHCIPKRCVQYQRCWWCKQSTSTREESNHRNTTMKYLWTKFWLWADYDMEVKPLERKPKRTRNHFFQFPTVRFSTTSVKAGDTQCFCKDIRCYCKKIKLKLCYSKFQLQTTWSWKQVLVDCKVTGVFDNLKDYRCFWDFP